LAFIYLVAVTILDDLPAISPNKKNMTLKRRTPMTKRNTTALMIDEPVHDSNEMLASEIEQHIRQRAFELYEQRGKADGLAEQDWLQAEGEILGSRALKAAA
jgi:hypothetical protein